MHFWLQKWILHKILAQKTYSILCFGQLCIFPFLAVKPKSNPKPCPMWNSGYQTLFTSSAQQVLKYAPYVQFWKNSSLDVFDWIHICIDLSSTYSLVPPTACFKIFWIMINIWNLLLCFSLQKAFNCYVLSQFSWRGRASNFGLFLLAM